MKTINSLRKNIRIDGQPNGDYVLYWMQINRRTACNYALEYAVAWANKLGKPLVILEGLACDYPWATRRTSVFAMQGMAEHASELSKRSGLVYIPFPEDQPGRYEWLVQTLCRRAAILVSDEYPVFIMRSRNEAMQKQLNIPFHTIDSNGIIPMACSEKAPYSAYVFRRNMQKLFQTCWEQPPQADPLSQLGSFEEPLLPEEVQEIAAAGRARLETEQALQKFCRELSTLDQNVDPVAERGTRKAALERLDAFVTHDLHRYDEERNDPDTECTSRLSPWLHFGKISVFEVVNKVFDRQPEGWNATSFTPVAGKREGFFGGHSYIESFLDEVITWREVGFHFAWHTPDYDQYESLPEWARISLSEHESDTRSPMYSLEELAQSKTADPLWNAAQTQLREEGRIHNYMRMLWGKKVLEWTPDTRTALEYLIELNNRYALDGRDPNSYSGIFWIFGRFDRAWGPERPIFGKVRYMSSDSARRKIKLNAYLERYSGSERLL